MLVIRMQRTGRKGHAQFRVVVQDSRFSPTSGRVVDSLGSYNPHAKTTTLDKEKAGAYLGKGAQPSDRVVQLLKNEGVKLPAWVKDPAKKERSIKHPEKLRRNRPPQEETSTSEGQAEEPAAEAEAPIDEPAEPEAPAEQQAEVAEQADEQAAATDNETPAEPEAKTPSEPAEQEETPAETEPK
jgi:small subunit ribosomal protein S16